MPGFPRGFPRVVLFVVVWVLWLVRSGHVGLAKSGQAVAKVFWIEKATTRESTIYVSAREIQRSEPQHGH